MIKTSSYIYIYIYMQYHFLALHLMRCVHVNVLSNALRRLAVRSVHRNKALNCVRSTQLKTHSHDHVFRTRLLWTVLHNRIGCCTRFTCWKATFTNASGNLLRSIVCNWKRGIFRSLRAWGVELTKVANGIEGLDESTLTLRWELRALGICIKDGSPDNAIRRARR